MKELMRQAKTFITSVFPSDSNYISKFFTATHNLQQNYYPYWSTSATRQKLIASYWYSYVLKHFACFFAFVAGWLLLTPGCLNKYFLPAVFLISTSIFFILLLVYYLPSFYMNYLPQLETVKESFEQKQFEQLEKCKKAQLSNFSLTLIFYVLDKISGINSLQCNDQYATLLTKLYGVDQGSLKKNLELILSKKKNLPQRKFTEIKNRFGEAFIFFEEMQCKEGVRILRELEQKFSISDK